MGLTIKQAKEMMVAKMAESGIPHGKVTGTRAQNVHPKWLGIVRVKILGVKDTPHWGQLDRIARDHGFTIES